jgi:hypothetical protein
MPTQAPPSRTDLTLKTPGTPPTLPATTSSSSASVPPTSKDRPSPSTNATLSPTSARGSSRQQSSHPRARSSTEFESFRFVFRFTARPSSRGLTSTGLDTTRRVCFVLCFTPLTRRSFPFLSFPSNPIFLPLHLFYRISSLLRSTLALIRVSGRRFIA